MSFISDAPPVTPEGLAQFDNLPAEEAVLKAWTETGPYSDYHQHVQNQIRRQMPVLGRALDRLALKK